MSIYNNFKLRNGLHWYHWLVIISSLALTYSAWQISAYQATQKTALQFNYESDKTISLVKERMGKYEDALWSGVAAIQSQDEKIDFIKWNRFSSALSIEDKYPGINGIGVINNIRPDAIESYLKKERIFRPEFTIHPQHNSGEYWPITYIEPEDINKKAVGLDIAHEINRLTAAKKARNTGTAQITAPIILVQDARKTPGFLFYAPFYQGGYAPSTESERMRQFSGIVYAPFIMEKLMEGTLQNRNRMVNFKISDAEDVLYDELNANSVDFDASPLFTKTLSIQMYGRDWVFDINSSNLFRKHHTSNQPTIILIGGIIIDFMLLILFYLMSNAKNRAIHLAEEITSTLQESEERLSATIDNIMDGLITITDDGTIFSFNTQASSIFRLPEEKALGYNISDLPVNFLGSKNEDTLTDVTKTIFTEPYLNKRSNVVLTASDGESIPVEISVNTSHAHDKDYFILTIRDLSEKIHTEKTLAETEALLDTAVQASSSGFAILDSNGTFITANQSLCKLLSYQHQDIQNLHMLNIVSETEYTTVNTLLGEFITGVNDSSQLEIKYETRSGNKIWGLTSVAAVREHTGKLRNIIINVVNIQKEKELLSEIINNNLALEKSNSDLEQFAYVASHDLKSPLNAIRQLSGWILEDCSNILPVASKNHLSLLIGRSVRMARLLDDLLSYSRVGKFNFENENVNLSKISKEQTQLLNLPMGFKISAPDKSIIIPRIPFEIVIRNLLSNAIKHHHQEHGNVEIKVYEEAFNYVITVKDDGPGIHPEMHSKVFEMFQTLRPRDEVEGSGMGLAMVSRIIAHYHGRIDIESDGESGTSIVIHWPLENTHTSTNGQFQNIAYS